MNNKSNAGFTLVEVLVALAISSIIMIAMGTVIVVGAKSYKKTSDDVTAQQDSQETINFLNNLLIDAQYVEYKVTSEATTQRYISGYYKGEDYGDAITSNEKEAYRIIGEGVAGYTYLCVGKDMTIGDSKLDIKSMCYVVLQNNKLYYGKVEHDTGSTLLHSVITGAINKEDDIKGIIGKNEFLLADYLQDTNGFTLDFKKTETVVDAHTKTLDNLKVDIGLKLKKNDSKFETINEVRLRNF